MSDAGVPKEGPPIRQDIQINRGVEPPSYPSGAGIPTESDLARRVNAIRDGIGEKIDGDQHKNEGPESKQDKVARVRTYFENERAEYESAIQREADKRTGRSLVGKITGGLGDALGGYGNYVKRTEGEIQKLSGVIDALDGGDAQPASNFLANRINGYIVLSTQGLLHTEDRREETRHLDSARTLVDLLRNIDPERAEFYDRDLGRRGNPLPEVSRVADEIYTGFLTKNLKRPPSRES